ncbi:MAG TPA: DUF935 family protein [Armatimonadaceae bacterium]|nr:DUF935 family protein [Armatimonadaceae bacterium]
MQRDAQVRACLTTKRLSILSESAEVHPADDSAPARRAADVVRAQVEASAGGWVALVTGALDALAMGFAVGEYRWHPDGSFAGVRWHDPRRFAALADGFGDVYGVEVADAGLWWPRERFVWYAHQPRYGNPYGESDLVAAYRAWANKDTIRRMWLTGLDRFAIPTPIAITPISWTQEQLDRLAEQLGNLQAQSSIVVPEGVEIKTTLESGRAEPAHAFVTAIQYEDGQIARAILGQELTTQGSSSSAGGGGGSYALGAVHQGVADDWVQAICSDLAESVLTAQVARTVAAMALGPDVPPPAVRFPNLTDAERRSRRELVAAMLTGAVIAPGEGWIRSYLGLPELGS